MYHFVYHFTNNDNNNNNKNNNNNNNNDNNSKGNNSIIINIKKGDVPCFCFISLWLKSYPINFHLF